MKKVVTVARISADGIAAADASPPEIAGPAGNTTDTVGQPYPLPQVVACSLHLAAKGYESRDLPVAAFIDQCGDFAWPLVSGSGEGICDPHESKKMGMLRYEFTTILSQT